MEMRKSYLSREDICNVITDIINIQETVHYDLQELKQKSTKKFQKTDSFIKEYQELKQYVLKIRGNFNEKSELLNTIVTMDLATQSLKNELYNKNISNLTESRNPFQANEECCYHLLVQNV